MASPPYRSPAASPPGPANAVLPNPRKRPIGAPPSNPGAYKRRKASTYSTTSSSHPLRQTSFPPEESLGGLQRSPSVDSDDLSVVTGNQSVAPSTTGGPKKRGRKKKTDAVSVKSSSKPGPSDAASRAEGADDEGEEEEEADVGDEDMVDEGAKIDQLAEKKKIAVLMDAFNADQSERYNSYRRAKLKKETVRKITNQTLSQSVPPSVVTTINGFTKVFIGTLIERARDIQRENAIAARTMPTPPASSGQQTQDSTQAAGGMSQFTPTLTQESVNPIMEDDSYLGPLTPDDIREAYRRYRKNGEGGGSGVSGASVGLGVSGSAAARIREKRMFR